MPPELHLEIANLRNYLRPDQRKMSYWQSGEMAVAAVPGAGKSTGMATLAAITIAENNLNRRHQLIIVTFTKAAANSIRSKITAKLEELFTSPRGLGTSPPVRTAAMRRSQAGFSVNTLHGLAFNIASSHRELSGFSQTETRIISEAEKLKLMGRVVEDWIKNSPRQFRQLISGQSFDGEDAEGLRRSAAIRTDILPKLAAEIIAIAKSAQLTPKDLKNHSDFLEIGAGLYETYVKLLRSAAAIDYDDMIIGAIKVLENPAARQFWQERTFAVFEDEAQDSAPLQGHLLRQLATNLSGDFSSGFSSNLSKQVVNFVRVGDPNQAINSTFTNSDPRFFNEFCQNAPQVVHIAEAARSCQEIINAANFVLNWVNNSSYAKTTKPFLSQIIKPVGDINPSALGAGVEIQFPEDIADTVTIIKNRILDLFSNEPDLAIAILVRNHNQGRFLYQQLFSLQDAAGIAIYDVEDRNRSLKIPFEMLHILQFIERPHSVENLQAILKILTERRLIKHQDLCTLANLNENFEENFNKILPEQFLYPTPLDPPLSPANLAAAKICTSLLRAHIELPLYNLIAFIALSLGYDQSELATADKLSQSLRQELFGNYNIKNLLLALEGILQSHKFEIIEAENPESQYTKPRQVTIISLHKSKGLDWDVVFMPFLNKKMCPGESFVAPANRFLGDFNLVEVARMQIRALASNQEMPSPETAWQNAQILKEHEEFRLLYMGMTRAKRLLHISSSITSPFTWNNLGNISKIDCCPAITALAKEFPQFVISD